MNRTAVTFANHDKGRAVGCARQIPASRFSTFRHGRVARQRVPATQETPGVCRRVRSLSSRAQGVLLQIHRSLWVAGTRCRATRP